MTTPARANLVLPRPLLRPVVELDFLGSAPLVVRGVPFAVTRSSNGTYFDSTGTLQTASSNVARFDYNPLTLAPLGLLVEEQRTNSIRNNTMQGAAAGTPGTLPTNWSTALAGLTRTVVGTGTSNGVTYIDVRVNGTTSGTSFTLYHETTTQIAAVSGQTWTTSAWLSVVGGSTANITAWRLNVDERDSGGGFLNQRVVAITAPDGTLTRQNGQIATANASCAYVLPYFAFAFSSGVAIDVTLRIGMPQLELGASATSVIATSGAAATRNADNAVISTISPWFNPVEGTVVFEGDVNATTADGTGRVPWGFSDDTSNEVIYGERVASSANLRVVVIDGGVAQAAVVGGAVSVNTVFKSAFAYKANDFAHSLNGAAAVTDTAGTLPTVNKMVIGNYPTTGASAYWNGHIRRLSYYNTRLTNAQLQALSTL